MPSNRTPSLFALLLTTGSHLLSQGLGANNPSKEYVRLGGQVIAIENATLPQASLSASSLTFAAQALNTPSLDQSILLTNTGGQTLTFSSVPTLSGVNAGDFSVSGTNCVPVWGSVGGKAACIVFVHFSPQFVGTRTAVLTFTDNAGGVAGSTQTVALSGTGGGTAPSGFTTYLAPYGGVQSPYTGPEAVLPVRGYIPGGASNIGYLQLNLNASTAGEFSIYAQSDGAGGYTLRVANATGVVPSPYLEMTASGQTVTLATPIVLGTLEITSYRFALVGNEFQLDLGLSRSGAFNDQIVIFGVSKSNAYSSPWGVSVGQWSNLTVAGSVCNGASIATSIAVGDGSWQCWPASQLGTTSAPVYGVPYWNGDSGDGPSANIGWLLLGTGNYGTQIFGSTIGTLGYFGLAGGEQPESLYFANTGSSVTINLVAALTNYKTVESLGWYSVNPSSPDTAPTAATMHTLVGPFVGGVLSATFQPSAYYGLYMTGPYGTYFTQPEFNPDSLEHFAVFQQTAGFYYIGAEDTDETLSDLDYNDMVITLSTAVPSAKYVGSDTTTQGTWTGTYGAGGELIANDVTNPPAYATVSLTGDSLYTWAASTADVRGLQIASGSSSRIASTYYSTSSFTINVNVTDGKTHRIALYLLDWDSTARTESISVLNAVSGAVLDTETFSSFHNGEYAAWNVTGDVQIKVTKTGGVNAVVSGIFFD